MRPRSAVIGASSTVAAAVLGNAFIGREAMGWFKGLQRPRGQLSMPAFVTVGAAYYVVMGFVLSRALDRGEPRSIRWAATVLVGNEAWNLLLFGRRSPENAFFGLLAFLLPLGCLQRAVWPDRPSRWALLPYTVYVLGYDLPWSYRLWRLNPTAAPTGSDGPDRKDRHEL
jgi:tryptophan-rich sensory protein